VVNYLFYCLIFNSNKNILAPLKKSQSKEFLVNSLLKIISSFHCMLLKTSNKSLKNFKNLAVYAALAYDLLNDTKVKISVLTELLKV